MGISADIKCCDDYTKNCNDVCPVTAEDIHRVLLEAYDVLTDCSLSFDEKKEKLYCLEKKYRCYVDILRPYSFKYYKDCFGFEYLIFLASVGDFVVDMVVYSDLDGWINLDTGSCVRNIKYGGCSKLQNTVSKRRDLCGKEKELYDAKKKEIDRIKLYGEFCYGKNSVLDWRCKPKCEIMKPCDLDKVDPKFAVLVKITNWYMECDGKCAILYVNDCEVARVTNCELVYVDITDLNLKSGYHKLCLKLVDENGKYIGICCEQQIKICCPKKCEKKVACPKKCEKKVACPKKCEKWCDDSSSSSSCPSSSSILCSEVSSVVYNFEDSYACEDVCEDVCEDSSSSCSSSSSSSEDCKKKCKPYKKVACKTGKCNLKK